MAAERFTPPRVTLVIGAGGLRCAAALGVVQALAEAGIGVERVVGCSTGAIFAALVAFGGSSEESKALALRLWKRELAGRWDMFGLLRTAAPRLFAARAEEFTRHNPQRLLGRLPAAWGALRIEDALLPLHLTATNFATGELVELTTGPLMEAMRASLAWTPALVTQSFEGRLLVDGCLADPLPVSVAIKHGARIIVAVGFENPLQGKVERGTRASLQMNAILANNLLRAKLAFHGVAHHAEMIVVMPEFKNRTGLFDTDKLAWIIEQGEQAALQQLPYLHHLLASDQGTLAG